MSEDMRYGLARALYEDDMAHGRASLDWDDLDSDGLTWYLDQADAALAYLVTRPSVDVEAVARVLREHTGQGESCDCGAFREPRPGAPWSGWHARHQAEQIATLTPDVTR